MPRPDGTYDVGDAAIVRLAVDEVCDPTTNVVIQNPIPSGVQFRPTSDSKIKILQRKPWTSSSVCLAGSLACPRAAWSSTADMMMLMTELDCS